MAHIKTNVRIGDPSMQNLYQTTNRMPDPRETDWTPSVFSDAVKKDLRAVHFQLGWNKTPSAAEKRDVFTSCAKNSFIRFSPKQAKDAIRVGFKTVGPSNLKFGDDTGPTVESHAQAAYTKKPIDLAYTQLHRVMGKDNTLGHIKLGNEKLEYSTTNKLPEPVKGVQYQFGLKDANLTKTNWSMGSDKLSYESTMREANSSAKECPSFLEVPPNFDRLLAKTLAKTMNKSATPTRDKASEVITKDSVVLGEVKVPWSSTASDLKKPDIDVEFAAQTRREMQKLKKSNQSSSLVFGTDAFAPETTSSQLYDPKRTPVSLSDLRPNVSAKQLQKTNFVVGSEKVDYVSDNAAGIFSKNIDYAGAIRKAREEQGDAPDVKSSHITLGSRQPEEQAMPPSLKQSNFKPPAKSDYGQSIAYKPNLAGSNWTFGSDKSKWISTQRAQMNNQLDEKYHPKAVDKEEQVQRGLMLRKTNISLGQDALSYETAANKDYTRFASKEYAVGAAAMDKTTLQKHHFSLGYAQDVKWQSTNSEIGGHSPEYRRRRRYGNKLV